jgi:hypothetical protein
MESINGLYKAECIRTTVFHDGPYRTIRDVEFATAGWVDWYNTRGFTRASATSHPPSSSKPTTRPSTESRNPHRSGIKPGALHPRVVKRKVLKWAAKREHHAHWPQPHAPTIQTLTH